MTMIKCPECRHHISSMAKACPECGCPIDPEWAEAEAKREQESLDEVPFTVETGVEEEAPSTIETGGEDGDSPSALETGVEEQTHLNPPLKGGGEEDSTDDTPRSLREGMGESPESPKSPERPETPAAAPKRSSAGGMFIGLVVLLGLLIGGLYYYDYYTNQKREQRAYELLQGCSNPAFYEDFMVRYPKSEYIDEVKERYAKVAAQQNQWQQLVKNGTRDELQAFVRQHPGSPYVKVAQVRIDSLDWASAKESRELEAVTHYMAIHPDGYYIDQAETLRQQLEREKAQEAARRAAARRDSLARADSIANANSGHSITINLPF